MREVFTPLLALCLVSVCVSWVVYLPIFLSKLRVSKPADFQQLGGSLWNSSLRAPDIVTYLLRRQYLDGADESVKFHGGILRWTLAIACVTSVVLGTLFFLLETFGR